MLRGILLNSYQWSAKDKLFSVKQKFCSVNAKCGAAKIYGLHLGLSNSNLSSHTFHSRKGTTYEVKWLASLNYPSNKDKEESCLIVASGGIFPTVYSCLTAWRGSSSLAVSFIGHCNRPLSSEFPYRIIVVVEIIWLTL